MEKYLVPIALVCLVVVMKAVAVLFPAIVWIAAIAIVVKVAVAIVISTAMIEDVKTLFRDLVLYDFFINLNQFSTKKEEIKVPDTKDSEEVVEHLFSTFVLFLVVLFI